MVDKNPHDFEWEEDEQGGSQSGAAGEIHFRYKDSFSTDPRDDALSPEVIKRLQLVHKELHKAFVDKQKATRNERLTATEQQLKAARQRYTLGAGGGSGGKFPPHPTLTQSAQFSNTQMNPCPSENVEKTNEGKRNELQHQHQYQHQPTPGFNPRPQRPF